MKALVKVTGDNGTIPPSYYHQYSLTFFDNGKARFEIFDERQQGKTILEETANYNSFSLDSLADQLTGTNQTPSLKYHTNGESKKVIDYRTAIPATFNIGMDDSPGQQLFNQFLALCHTNLINRINQLFFK